MNKPIVYLPLSFSVILAIVYISLNVPSFSLLLHFTRLLYVSIGLTILTGIYVYLKYKDQMDFENLYMLTGSTVLFSFVIWFALIALFNKNHATKHCEISSYELVSYKGRMASAYGKLEKDKIKANQWVLTILKEGKEKTFVLNKDISDGERVTKTMDLEFCKGLLGTEYLNIEQIPK